MSIQINAILAAAADAESKDTAIIAVLDHVVSELQAIRAGSNDAQTQAQLDQAVATLQSATDQVGTATSAATAADQPATPVTPVTPATPAA